MPATAATSSLVDIGAASGADLDSGSCETARADFTTSDLIGGSDDSRKQEARMSRTQVITTVTAASLSTVLGLSKRPTTKVNCCVISCSTAVAAAKADGANSL